jgi:hypothetical protein
MGSLVGAKGVRISAHKKKRSKSKATGAYAQRNQNLPWLGYASYREYLQSDDWKLLRQAALNENPTCVTCNCRATAVHHYCYNDSVLLGLYPELLLPMCAIYHHDIEFRAKEKQSLPQVQQSLLKKLRRLGRTDLVRSIQAAVRHMLGREQDLQDAQIAKKQDYLERLQAWEVQRAARKNKT